MTQFRDRCIGITEKLSYALSYIFSPALCFCTLCSHVASSTLGKFVGKFTNYLQGVILIQEILSICFYSCKCFCGASFTLW